jgi:hypothetical protein
VLGNRGEPVVKDVLEAAVVRLNAEGTRPKVRLPMAKCLHKTYYFTLVGSKLGVAGGDGLAKEGDGTVMLMKDGPKSCARRVAVNHELFMEIGELEHRPHGEGVLQLGKSIHGCLGPPKRLLLEQGGERCCDEAVVVDELAVVLGEAEEPAQRLDGLGLRPCLDCCYLGLVHGSAVTYDDVTEVCHAPFVEGTLGTLECQAVLT